MIFRIKKITQKIIFTSLLLLLLLPIFVHERAHAQLAVLVAVDASFTSIQRTINSQYTYLKDYVLDHLAVAIAQQVIQQMTSSIITWINTGFNGSPSFLTNPSGFFLDVGDQVTGQFLGPNSPLSTLCSPFSKDIRIAIALDRAQNISKRYTCTLSTVIKNVKNASIDGFTAGDFSQGGWPAFVTMTTEPQNNPLGAYVQAQQDISDAITKKEATINLDLTRGSGFLSYQDCHTVSFGQEYYNEYLNDYVVSHGVPGTDEECTTETPGSVISGTLQKQLGSPTDKLNLVKSINDIIDAALNQMIYQLVNTGLASLNQSSGGKKSYADQLAIEANSTNSAVATEAQARTSVNLRTQTKSFQDAIDTYTKAIQLATESQNKYQTALSCFVSKSINTSGLSSTQMQFAQTNITNITSVLDNEVNPLVTELTQKQSDIQAELDKLQDATSNSGLSPAQLLDNATQFAQIAGGTLGKKGGDANVDLQDTKDSTKIFNQEAGDYQRACNQFPTVY